MTSATIHREVYPMGANVYRVGGLPDGSTARIAMAHGSYWCIHLPGETWTGPFDDFEAALASLTDASTP